MLRGEQRAGCHRASLGMLWDPATLGGTWEVSPSGVAPETASWRGQSPEQPGNGGSRGCPESVEVLGWTPNGPRPSPTCAEPAAVVEGGRKAATAGPGRRSQSHQEPVWEHTGRAACGLGDPADPSPTLVRGQLHFAIGGSGAGKQTQLSQCSVTNFSHVPSWGGPCTPAPSPSIRSLVASPPPLGCHLHLQPPASAWPRVSIWPFGWRTRPGEAGRG